MQKKLCIQISFLGEYLKIRKGKVYSNVVLEKRGCSRVDSWYCQKNSGHTSTV